MKPFNLERALAGDKVVTRDGREVSELRFLQSVSPNGYCVVAVIDGDPFLFLQNGKITSINHFDLFMAPKTVKRWVNFYPTDCFSYPIEEDAKTYAYKNAIAIAVPVEFEEGYGIGEPS